MQPDPYSTQENTHISLRLPQTVLFRVEEYARKMGFNRTVALRIIIEAGLNGQLPSWTAPPPQVTTRPAESMVDRNKQLFAKAGGTYDPAERERKLAERRAAKVRPMTPKPAPASSAASPACPQPGCDFDTVLLPDGRGKCMGHGVFQS